MAGLGEQGGSPDSQEQSLYSNSRAVINACRPYEWKDDFPAVSATSPELEAKLVEKYGEKKYQ